ncbi:F-box/LRR-repeat protein At4g29420-like [Bidens hawaiensis]|uniref:F-box/LRR-repeat protein At4g29420-like n=1 Tax=Bidens hawaiensis TaxID=980011 RepID=UPI0040492D2C
MSAIRFSPVGRCKSNVLLLISAYCHNLVTLKLKFAWLRTHNLNPMAMLTSLTLKQIDLVDENLNDLNKCFPNLQVLNMEGVRGLNNPEIRHLNLKAFRLADVYSDYLPSLTLITPNLITLKVACFMHIAIHVEAPMLSHYHLSITSIYPEGVFTSVQYEKPREWSDTYYISSLLSNFSTTKSLQTLKLYLGTKGTRDTPDSKVSIIKVLTPFPNVSSERINSRVWSEIEAGFNPKDLENFNVRKELKSICAYLIFGDLSWTISSVACVLDKCVGLSEVSLLIHSDVSGSESSKCVMLKCMVLWPGLKWKWGIWNEHREDSWITDGIYDKHHGSSKKHRFCLLN